MPAHIKYRIIGALVLVIVVSLGAQFVWRASDTGRRPATVKIDWPTSVAHTAPEGVVLDGSSADDSVTLEQASVSEALPVSSMTEPLSEDSAPTQLVSANQRTSWVIQLATFKQRANAERLVAQLKTQGYEAYFRQQTAVNGVTLIRVYVGPMSDRQHIDQALEALLTENGLQGIPMRATTGAV